MSQLKCDTEKIRFVKYSEFHENFTINDVTEKAVMQNLGFLHCELKLA